MFTQHDVQILVSQLPDRSVAKIKKKTKISRPTINKFLRGEKVTSDKAERIYAAALSLIRQNRKKESKLRRKSTQLFNTNPGNK